MIHVDPGPPSNDPVSASRVLADFLQTAARYTRFDPEILPASASCVPAVVFNLCSFSLANARYRRLCLEDFRSSSQAACCIT